VIAVTAALKASRYGELEKLVQREDDPAKKKLLEREMLQALRLGRSA
jgi:hypothetical protein